jgi:hypothetical protein
MADLRPKSCFKNGGYVLNEWIKFIAHAFPSDGQNLVE